jgi:hypothetical protein
MAEQAKVSSIDVLETFRAALIIFLGTAHRCLDEATDEVRRTRMWLQGDQLMHWQTEIRKRQKKLDALEQELFGAKISGLRDPSPQLLAQVRKAKEALHEAETKLRNTKMWIRNFDHRAGPLTHKLESLRFFLNHDMPKGLAFLVQAQKTLEAYTNTPLAASAPSAPASAAPEAPVAPAPEDSAS